MDTLYNDMCDTLSCWLCDLTLIALFYLKKKLCLFLSTAKTKTKKNKRKKTTFFYISIVINEYNLLYTVFSRILENEESKVTGL